MGHDPDREPPFFFMKPATAIVTDGNNMAYPSLSNDVHHEIEMVVALGKGGANIHADQALDHVDLDTRKLFSIENQTEL